MYSQFIALSKTVLPDHPIPSHLEKHLGPAAGPIFEKDIIGDVYEKFFKSLASTMDKRLMISNDQDIGVVLNCTEVGDVICILLGCSFLVILRQNGDGFKLVGFAMIDGFMDGEAMSALSEGKYYLRDFDIL